VPITQPEAELHGNGADRSRTLITDALCALLEQEVPHDPQRRTYVQLIVYELARKAINGDVQAAALINGPRRWKGLA
jgi:hypothetical protein